MSLTNTDHTDMCYRSTRRGFIRAGSMALLSAGLWLSSDVIAFGQEKTKAEADPAVQQQSRGMLTRSKFKPYQSEYFVVRVNGETIYLQLLEISDLAFESISDSARSKKDSPSFKAKLQEESFSLIFRSSSETMLQQNTWKLSHDTLGSIELFLVPVNRPEGPWHYYEAVFNRLQK